MPTETQTIAPPGDTAAATDDSSALPGHARTAFAVVIDGESSIRHFVSLLLQGTGIDTMDFESGAAFRASPDPRSPDIIFLDVNLDVGDAIQTLEALGSAQFKGLVQLFSNRGSAVLEKIRQVGEEHSLHMLKPLKKPFETSTIQKIVFEHKIGFPPPGTAQIGLDEALRNNWIEFWYQPKVDLRRKQLAGAEIFARVRHPEHGILTPGSFMSGADDSSLIKLAELGIANGLKAGINIAKAGINLRIAVNVPIAALEKLPIGDIVRAHRPETDGWPGLILDLAEEQIVKELSFASEMSKKFEPHNVRLAIDDFGRAYASLTKVKELPFAEMKLSRSFVNDCATDKVNAPICKTVIALAHNFRSLAVGIGVEKASDVMALTSMGCDLGQGFLLGQPMPEDRFIALLKQRASVRPSRPPMPAPVLKSA